MSAVDSSSDMKGQEPAPNSIRGRGRQNATNASVPDEIAKRFVQVNNKFYFPDGARAFTDRGNRLTTLTENTEVIRSLIDIAKVRAWQKITVRGTERFRKEVWRAASVAGLEVRSYKPTEFEQSRQARTPARERQSAGYAEGQDVDSIARGSVGEEPRPHVSGRGRASPLIGKLVDLGRAPYNHDPRAGMSYFVRLETLRGTRVIWGVDLERAFKESLTKPEPGDAIGLKSVRHDAVTVKKPTRGADGQVTGEQSLNTHRNRWVVEKLNFFEARAAAAKTLLNKKMPAKEAVRAHPELVGSYLAVHAAELAAKRFPDPKDRALFVAKVRAALADSVVRGEPLPPVRLRERAKSRAPDPREREPEPTRG
jgi:hypothetical protein